MDKIYRQIIKSSKEPNKENIWLCDDSLYYYENGKWKLIKDKVSLNNSQDKEANVQAPIIKLNNTTTDKIYNIETCSKLSTSEVISVNIEGTIGGLTYDTIGIYHNGTVSILEGNKCTVFDIDFNTGLVTIDSKYDTSKFLSYVDLQIGDSDSVKQYNLERLKTGTFFTQIDYGFGTGTWNSTNGGSAHIITALGNTVYYDISNTGIVKKQMESSDIYSCYLNSGGTKTITQFCDELFSLIGG